MGHETVDESAYDSEFFAHHIESTLASAAQVVPVILELLPSDSVLDVGCGIGAWASVFLAQGVADVGGVDGDYIDRKDLLIEPEAYHAGDLTQPFDLGRRFDLVVCLEVAEHLPAQYAGTLVRSLVRHSDLVVFSAAIPGQGGRDHVNEQWPRYWSDHFAHFGYEVFDPLRPRLWHESRIRFWYRQNLLVYAAGVAAERVRALPRHEPPLDLVHPELIEGRMGVPPIRVSLRFLIAGVWRRLGRLAR